MKGLTVVILLLVVALTLGLMENIPIRIKRVIGPNTTKEAKPDQFNYQVGLLISPSHIFCGGSLISPEWIVTAAHCTDRSTYITAYLGSTQRKSGTKVKVLEIIIHNEWNKTTVANDISLLRIATVTLGTNINIVKLPSLSLSNSSFNFKNFNEKVIASGWGYTNDKKTLSKMLRYINMQIVSNLVCSNLLNLGHFEFRSSNICAQGQIGERTCKGDSGGPLVTKSTKILIGINSFGYRKCILGYPGAFTRIMSYRSWIFEKTGV